jgi:YDG domain
MNQTLNPVSGSNPPAASASFTITRHSAGSHALNATYAGSGVMASSSASGSISINAMTLTVTATASNKVYDGTTNAVVTYSDNRLSGDIFTVSGLAAFSDRNVSSDKPVSITSMYLSGVNADNYVLASTTATATASITAATVMPSVTVNNKTRDGTTAETLATRTLSGAIGTDNVTLSDGAATFADERVGTNKLVTVTGPALSGTTAGIYQLSPTTVTPSANINPVN